MSQNKKIDKSAKVLFSVFKENNVDQLGSEVLATLSKISNNSQKFKQFLSTKRIDLKVKKEILSNIFSESLNQSQLSLVYCLLDNIDFNYLETIDRKYQKLMQDSKGHVNVKAVTAFQLSETELSSPIFIFFFSVISFVFFSFRISSSIVSSLEVKDLGSRSRVSVSPTKFN